MRQELMRYKMTALLFGALLAEMLGWAIVADEQGEQFEEGGYVYDVLFVSKKKIRVTVHRKIGQAKELLGIFDLCICHDEQGEPYVDIEIGNNPVAVYHVRRVFMVMFKHVIKKYKLYMDSRTRKAEKFVLELEQVSLQIMQGDRSCNCD